MAQLTPPGTAAAAAADAADLSSLPSAGFEVLPSPSETAEALASLPTEGFEILEPPADTAPAEPAPSAAPPSLASWFRLSPSLPYSTPSLPGVGGSIKAIPAHFRVTENLQVSPDGRRDPNSNSCHYFLTVTREGMNTADLQAALARATGNKPVDVGVCGLKDKHARCTQTFSVPSLRRSSAKEDFGELKGGDLSEEEVKAAVSAAVPGLTIESLAINICKLRRNQHSGNTFRIVLTNLDVPVAEALSRSLAIAEALATKGWPNYYGDQRFGATGGTALRGLKLLQACQDPAASAKARKKAVAALQYAQAGKFAASAYASMQFNVWLARRMEKGTFDEAEEGDLLLRPYGDALGESPGELEAAASGLSRKEKKKQK
jgi:TruD family tRNA pseudouridine synthase